ncbi:MAG: hypothetical protein Q4B59_01355 [Lachnospiraceae bacterium]|nr:hypothetical protein [Lachnospiraceae bacterium]
MTGKSIDYTLVTYKSPQPVMRREERVLVMKQITKKAIAAVLLEGIGAVLLAMLIFYSYNQAAIRRQTENSRQKLELIRQQMEELEPIGVSNGRA